MKLFRARWFRISASVVFVAYFATAVLAVRPIHRELRKCAVVLDMQTGKPAEDLVTMVRFRYTFPILPALVICRWDFICHGNDGSTLIQENRSLFFVRFTNPYEIQRKLIRHD